MRDKTNQWQGGYLILWFIPVLTGLHVLGIKFQVALIASPLPIMDSIPVLKPSLLCCYFIQNLMTSLYSIGSIGYKTGDSSATVEFTTENILSIIYTIFRFRIIWNYILTFLTVSQQNTFFIVLKIIGQSFSLELIMK